MRRLMLAFAIYGLLLVPLSYIVPHGAFFVLFSLFFVCGITALYKGYNGTIKGLKDKYGSKIERHDEEKHKFTEEIDRADERISELRNKEMMMVSLYEITKKMSTNLTFSEIFNALSVFLKQYFVFKKSELIILKEHTGYIKIDKVYKLYKKEEYAEDDLKTDYGDILMLFSKDKEGVYISKEGSGSLGAIPLLSENKFVGILTVEDLPQVDFERFVIVATQFALEIKKVLLYETVEELAITDSLTGLYTRRYFFERLNEELNRSKKHGFKFSFLMIDIDDFKKVNDSHGHLVGDSILKEIARIIKENIREIDLVARYGGEEFSLILPETDKKGSMLAAERIRKKIEDNVFRAYDVQLKVTVSTGIAVYPENARETEEIIEKADKALYVAKSSGKNIVCEYTD